MQQHKLLLAALAVSLFFMHSTVSLATDSNSVKQQSWGNLPIQIGLSGLFSAGGSSADNDELSGLQAGGHDPNRNGFTVQNVELSLSSTVDNYFDAQANLIFLIDTEGETVVELEEAFLTTRGLSSGLQIKAGQFFTEFGRQNKQHPHTWAFVDQPVILSRLFGGDGLRSQGARLAWLMPVGWYSELYLGAQNANGETVTSFLFAPGEEVAGHTLQERSANKGSELLYNARWLNGLDLSETVSMNIGFSGLIGPNSSGADTDTVIYGADIYLKWQPLRSQRGFPFVAWHTEFLKRDYDAGDVTDPSHETLKDSGGFTQVLWGFKPGWIAGLRYDFARANGNTATDPQRDNRTRISPNVTWYLSEYSKLRLQYNYDKTEHLADNTNHSLWLQYEFNIGSHAAHTF
ncbi:MAG: hypothetical protein L3J98_14265 [Gammaproteobacteria bacterium]|nr:hypothetical protein [Gammaproteobacteria bacterium]MCF6261302.1 hypothetical protein [Gammaproteobacteria bacterium]